MRLFIAIKLDVKMRSAIVSVQEQFRKAMVRGNYSKAENLHLTLAFIGEYQNPDKVMQILNSISFAPMTLRLDRLGAFGELWKAGLYDCPELFRLVKKLRRALSDGGVPFDKKAFSPHITFLREARFEKLPFTPPAVPEAEMIADCVSLMLSIRGKNGMIYTELGSVYSCSDEE